MNFNRKIYDSLKSWKSKTDRKPLLLMGVRQIGKTTILKSFGQEEYEDLIYLNFEQLQNIHSFFIGDKNPNKILEKISLLHGRSIKEHKTLIVFDEIQECKDALISLKYFCEQKPGVHIIGAGSLLGLSIGNGRSFPVGKVEFLEMYPLAFEEYLELADSKLYSSYLHFLDQDGVEALPKAFFEPLQAIHKEYILFGGMPEVASAYLVNRNVGDAHQLQDQILKAYQLDFVKHAEKTTSTKIQRVWNSIPSQLARDNKKFMYKLIKTGARAREYEEAIQWLIQAGLLYKVSGITTAHIPLKAYEDLTSYKLYVFDTSLLVRLAGLDPRVFIDGHQFFKEFKGSIAENYVSQCLKATIRQNPYYWTSDGKAEIDFVIEYISDCIPIEVKSGAETKAKSLGVYQQKFAPPLRVRVSNLNLNLTGDLLNIPLFYADRIPELISKVI